MFQSNCTLYCTILSLFPRMAATYFPNPATGHFSERDAKEKALNDLERKSISQKSSFLLLFCVNVLAVGSIKAFCIVARPSWTTWQPYTISVPVAMVDQPTRRRYLPSSLHPAWQTAAASSSSPSQTHSWSGLIPTDDFKSLLVHRLDNCLRRQSELRVASQLDFAPPRAALWQQGELLPNIPEDDQSCRRSSLIRVGRRGRRLILQLVQDQTVVEW